jgi:uncharacterized protein
VDGTLDLKVGPKRQPYHPTALIPGRPIPARAMQDALVRIADHVIANGMDGPGPYRAVRDLLMGRAPRVTGIAAGERFIRDGEPPLEAARRIASDLDDTVLPIQGPPGTGKTYTGARMIVELLRHGKRVGIAAQSHKAISNLLREVCEAAAIEGVAMRAIQKCDTGDEVQGRDGVRVVTQNKDVELALAEEEGLGVVAGTAWLFARAPLEGAVDVLFVDEAGQLSLANVVAMGGAASSIVLLGDPNQLPMVTQGVHPEGAGASALEHLLGEAVTLDDRLGLFLETTWRMHPAVNDYISTAFYDDRLRTHPSTELQRVMSDDPRLGGVGVRFIACEHDGNASRSPQEASAVADFVASLVGTPWTNSDGETKPIQAQHLIVVAPYNAHVAEISRAVEAKLGFAVPVGTVDKFQGQEGAVAIYSMASSSRDDAPRDMDFLYSRNRLNVAVSRARAVAIVVASPRLLEANCRTPEQMRLVNALCQLVEHAAASRVTA